MTAADIDDQLLIGRIAAQSAIAGGMGWVQSWDIQPWYPVVPYKVIQAKLRKLHKRGLIDGCPCGCRGDWTVTTKGMELLDLQTSR